DCQVLRLPTERRRSNSRGSLRIVSGLAVNTHSIFCDGPQGPETVNGCPVLPRQKPSPRGTRASCGFCQSSPCALLRSAPQENLFLLDKDLHGGRQLFEAVSNLRVFVFHHGNAGWQLIVDNMGIENSPLENIATMCVR